MKIKLSNKSLMAIKWILIVSFFSSIFLFFVFNSTQTTATMQDLELVKSDVGLTHACSYYRLKYSGSLLQWMYDIATIQTHDVKEVYGDLKDLTIEWLVNESYIVSIPDYGTCHILAEMNRTDRTCSDMGCVDYNKTHCNCSYSCVLGYHDETRYRQVWYPIWHGDYKKNKFKQYAEELNKHGSNMFKECESKGYINLRWCGNYKPERIYNKGWGVAIDHVPEFKSQVYSKFTWWNTSWQKRRKLTVVNASRTLNPYRLEINATSLLGSSLPVGIYEIRVINSTDDVIPFAFQDDGDVQLETGENVTLVVNLESDSSTDFYVYYENSTPVLPVNSSWNATGWSCDFEDGNDCGFYAYNDSGVVDHAEEHIITDPAFGNYALKLVDIQGVGVQGGAYYWNGTNLNPSGYHEPVEMVEDPNSLVYISYWVQTGGGTACQAFHASNKSAIQENIFALLARSAGDTSATDVGNIRAYDGDGAGSGTWYTIEKFFAYKWYRFEHYLNLTNNTYTSYVWNETHGRHLVAKNYHFRYDDPNFISVLTGTMAQGDATTGDYAIVDNIIWNYDGRITTTLGAEETPNTAPVISYVGVTKTSPANGSAYTGSQTFEANITDADDDQLYVYFYYNNTKLNLTNQNTTSYKYPATTSLGAGMWNITWEAYDGTATTTDEFWYEIVKATPTGSQSASPSWTVTYPTQTTVSCSLTTGDTGTTLTLKRDAITVATGTSPSETITLGAGSYSYTCDYPETENYTSATLDTDTLTVNKGTLSGSVTANDVTYPTDLTVSSSETNTGDTDVEYRLYCDNTLFGSSTGSAPCSGGCSKDFGAGSYTCKLNTTSSTFANWTSSASIATDTVTVNKGTLSGSIIANDVTYPTDVTATSSESNVGDADVNYLTCIDGVSCQSGLSGTFDLGVGTYTAVFNTSAGTYANWTQSSSIATDTVTVSKADPTANMILTLDGSSASPQSRTYPNETDIQSSETNIGDADCSYVLAYNGTTISNGLFRFNASGWNITYSTAGCTNYTAGQKEILLTVNTNSTTIHLALDGVEADKSYIYLQTSNATCWKSIDEGTLELYKNGTLVASGTTTSISHIAQLGEGKWNYTCYLVPANYTAPAVTRYATITKSVPGTIDAWYGYETRNISSTETIINLASYDFGIIEHHQNFSTISSSDASKNWTAMKTAISDANTQNIRSAVSYRYDGDYTDPSYQESVMANISKYFGDLRTAPYQDAVAMIIIELNKSTHTEDQIAAFVNNISQNISAVTYNYFPIYVKNFSSPKLLSSYVTTFTIPELSPQSPADFINNETLYMRTNTTLSRFYYNLPSNIMSQAEYFHDEIISNLRGKPVGDAGQQSEVAELDGMVDDIVVFNNQSTTQTISITITGRNGKDVWDATNNTLIEKDTDGIFTVSVPAYNASIIYFEDLDHISYTPIKSSLYKSSATDNTTMNYMTPDDSGTIDSWGIYGANDAKIVLWDGSYTQKNLHFAHYEWINSSAVANYTPYTYIIIADKNPAEINNTIGTDKLDKIYGYISVADYEDTDAWLDGKKAEVDYWVDEAHINIFIDGLDIGAPGANFETRIRNLTDYIRITKGKKAILNDYTTYENVSSLGDADMKESFCGRWDGDVNNPTYSYEDFEIDLKRAKWAETKNKPQLAVAYGDKDDMDKLAYCYAMWLVLYGPRYNNTFRYAQPNYQSQEEIWVIDPGTLLDQTWSNESTTDYYRRYSKGIVHIDPTTHTWSFDYGRTINSIQLCFELYNGASTPSANPGLNFTINNATDKIHTITYDMVAGGASYTWDTVCWNVSEDEFSSAGRYVIRMWSADRSAASGNSFSLRNENTTSASIKNQTGAHSWFDSSTNNYPATEPSWTSYGRNKNWRVQLKINATIKTSVDEFTGIISHTEVGKYNKNVTLSSIKSYDIPVWDNGTYIDSHNFEKMEALVNGVWEEINVTNTTTCDSDNPRWNISKTSDGKIWRACYKEISATRNYYRFAVPDLSSQTVRITSDSTPPTFSNWVQEPPDINSSSMGRLYINVTITDTSGVNDSTVKFYHFINNSNFPDEPWMFINGTAKEFYHQHNMTNVTPSIFNITLHTYAYNPTTFNVEPTEMESATKYNYSLDTNNEGIKIRFYNVSTKPNTTYIYKVRAFQNSGIMHVYYCNESYTTGKVYNSGNCVVIKSLTSESTSKYQNIYFYGDENSMTDGIKITNTSYFVLYADTTTDWEVEYAQIDSNSVFTTTGGGTVWNDRDYSLNSWLIQISGNDLTTLGYKVEACDLVGNCANSTVQTDSYAITQFPPSPPPNIIVPANQTYSGTFNITWTVSKDPNNDPFNYSIYLYNSDRTLNTILADNNITEGTEYLEWDSTTVSDGSYYIIANATDNETNTNFYIMPYMFTIDNTGPQFSNFAYNVSNQSAYAPNRVYQFNITITDASGVDMVFLELNGTVNYTVSTYDGNVWYDSNISDLGAGNYNITFYANDTINNWNSEIFGYTVNKSTTDISLYLNGTEGNVYLINNTAINITVVVNVTGETVYFETNFSGLPQQSGVTPLENSTEVIYGANNTYYNITGWYEGNENYTASSQTYYAIIYVPAIINAYVYSIGSYDSQVIVGQNVSAYYNISVNNTGYTAYTGNITVSHLISSFWINTSVEEYYMTVPALSTVYNHTNVTNVTVRRSNWNIEHSETASYDIYNYTETLTVYEPNVTKNLPVKMNISTTRLTNWDNRDDSLTVLKADGNTTGMSYTVYGSFPYVYPDVEITISTSHGYSSIDEGTHPIELTYYVSKAPAPTVAPAPSQGVGVSVPSNYTGNISIPTLNLTIIGPFPFKIIPAGAIQLLIFRNDTNEIVFNQTIDKIVEITLPHANYTIVASRRGYKPFRQTIELNSPRTLKISLTETGKVFGQFIQTTEETTEETEAKPAPDYTRFIIAGGLILLGIVVYLLFPEDLFKSKYKAIE